MQQLLLFLSLFFTPFLAYAGGGIESMRSHGYSVGIFAFMIVSMSLFVFIIVGYTRHKSASNMKRGEKIMIFSILAGVALSTVFAAVQLLDGFLF